MLKKLAVRDLTRNKVITAVLFLFIASSAALAAAAALMVAELSSSVSRFFEAAAVPHVVQMHAGDVDQAAIDDFSASQSSVVLQQTVEMIPVSAGALRIGSSEGGRPSEVMDNAFVKQSLRFDYLLDLDNRIAEIEPGEVGVPVYYKEQLKLQEGDLVRIVTEQGVMTWRIAAFVRDVQMNPALVSSKRFVLHEEDWTTLASQIEAREYLITFRLTDASLAGGLEQAYRSSGLPQQGPSITYGLLRTLHLLTDGIVIAVILLASLLLMGISALCLRFTMSATLEEDYREIGILRALGLPGRWIRRLYLGKYAVIAALACLAGYGVALPAGRLITDQMALYMGRTAPGPATYLVPLAAVGLVGLVVLVICWLMLGRLGRVSPVDAIRTGMAPAAGRVRQAPAIHRSRLPLSLLLAAKDIRSRLPMYSLLCGVYVLGLILLLVPQQLLHTFNSPDFISYMGAARSDLRLDLRPSGPLSDKQIEELDVSIQQDGETERYALFVTSAWQVVDKAGEKETIYVEQGDFRVFPLQYASGEAPEQADQLALSDLLANSLGKQVGDQVVTVAGGVERELTVSGIYQDITNGGKTAKALIAASPEDRLWVTAAIDLAEGTNLQQKRQSYAEAFPEARVTDMQDYLTQTLGGTIRQVERVSLAVALLSVIVGATITGLFYRLLLAKDTSQIAIMRSMGFAAGAVRGQYMARVIVLLAVGLILGTCLAGVTGNLLVGILGGGFGVSGIRLLPLPLAVQLGYTLMLAGGTACAAWFTVRTTISERKGVRV